MACRPCARAAPACRSGSRCSRRDRRRAHRDARRSPPADRSRASRLPASSPAASVRGPRLGRICCAQTPAPPVRVRVPRDHGLTALGVRRKPGQVVAALVVGLDVLVRLARIEADVEGEVKRQRVREHGLPRLGHRGAGRPDSAHGRRHAHALTRPADTGRWSGRRLDPAVLVRVAETREERPQLPVGQPHDVGIARRLEALEHRRRRADLAGRADRRVHDRLVQTAFAAQPDDVQDAVVRACEPDLVDVAAVGVGDTRPDARQARRRGDRRGHGRDRHDHDDERAANHVPSEGSISRTANLPRMPETAQFRHHLRFLRATPRRLATAGDMGAGGVESDVFLIETRRSSCADRRA